MAEKFRPTYQKFIKDFKKHFDKRYEVAQNVQKLLKAANSNNILQVKKLVHLKDSVIPVAAV